MSYAAPDCPSCASAAIRRLGSLPDIQNFAGNKPGTWLDGGALYACDVCHLKFRHPIQSNQAYQRLYDNNRIDSWTVDGERRDWNLIASLLRKLKPDAKSILDFGCYTGGLLDRIDVPAMRFGIEPNREAATRARASTGATVWNSIEEVPGSARFDVVLACDVIEHLPDPRELLERLLSMTAENGVLLVSTGNADSQPWRMFGANWWYCAYQEHIAFISESWLNAFLRSTKASLAHVERFPYLKLSPGRWIVSAIMMCAYGIAPNGYFHVRNAIRSIRGLGAATSAPGIGVSRDHFLVALRRD